MQYAEIPGNSRREFYDGKFPGIPEREFPVALGRSPRLPLHGGAVAMTFCPKLLRTHNRNNW